MSGMWIRINQKPLELPVGATVAEALDAFGAKPPFAVALNLSFVHRQNYAATVLQPDDELEIVQPVAGG
ncbi:MAG: sulfur carrier protein ThiS [Methylococcaceae bacterium]|nr:sulfur carrier protein ThiS [Methylococcaceae bacterium]